MESLINLMALAGPALLLAGFVLAGLRVIAIARQRGGRSAIRVLAVMIGLGLGGYLAGAFAGVWVACSSTGASNLCGLAGVVGTGPLVAGALLVAYARRRRTDPA